MQTRLTNIFARSAHIKQTRESMGISKNIENQASLYSYKQILSARLFYLPTPIKLIILIRNNSLIAYYSRQILFFIFNKANRTTMRSKNMADYTNFEGKTNKKIVQPPGGASSFSIGWSNERTDYGPERTFKKKEGFNSNETVFRSSNMSNVQKDYADQRQTINAFDMISSAQKEKSVKSITVMSECTTQSSEGYEPFKNHRGQMPVYCEESQPRNQPVKTGVRVKYPPGGKSSIIFG